MPSTVYAVATMDTKGHELMFVAQRLRDLGVAVKTVDVGTHAEPVVLPDVPRQSVWGDQPIDPGSDRGMAVTAMGQALRRYLSLECDAGRVAAVIGIGGSGGTAIITHAMRTMPIGLPKLMVSTVASGNTAPYVDCSDITMMYSVVDVAGLNVVLRKVLSNAATAVAGMVSHPADPGDSRPAIGMTMFGVTTPCVTRVQKIMDDRGYDGLVFHATGSGGRAMEQLVESGLIRGVLDVTTTEVADEIVGGVFPGGPERFDRLLRQEIPWLLSLGALDMVNFGAVDSVPAEFRHRQLHVHNPQVTLMRTDVDENREIARWIAHKLNQSTAPVTLLIPEGGLSMLDAPGQPFYDPEANEALFGELELQLDTSPSRQLVRLPQHINDPEFALAVVRYFEQLSVGRIDNPSDKEIRRSHTLE